jgi:hypothetical protein
MAYAFLTQKPILQPIFDPKHHRNHDKSIHGLKKNPKNRLKNQTQPKTKNQPEFRSVFS